jgi:hypothetical protein
MITVTTVQEREASETPFFMQSRESTGVRELFLELLRTSDNLRSADFFISSNKLTHTSIATYEDHAALDAFLLEVQAAVPQLLELREQYNAKHGITTTRETT